MALNRKAPEESLHEGSDVVTIPPRMDSAATAEYNFDTDGNSIVNAQLQYEFFRQVK
jgi:hypothetical protein